MTSKQISTRYLENGIEFQSHKYPEVFYGTTYEDNDAICYKLSFEPNIEALPKTHIININIFVVIIDILFIVFSILIGNSVLITSSILFSIFLSFKLDKLGKKKFSLASKFHAAKHKVFNAWEDLNYERIPTLDEAKQALMFSEECRDNKLLSTSLYCLLLLIITICTFKHIVLFLIFGILFEILYIFFIRLNLIQYLQVFTITEPTDRELILVLNALNKYIEDEKSIKMTIYDENEEVDLIEFVIGENEENETVEINIDTGK